MHIQFCEQQRDYWCGPACMQMLDSATEQSTFARRMHTNKRIGTTRQAMIQQVRTLKKHFKAYPHSHVADLRKHAPAIVNYQEVDGEDHYAIVLRIVKSYVVLHDPWHGPNYRLPLRLFTRRWKNQKLRKKYTGWMVALR